MSAKRKRGATGATDSLASLTMLERKFLAGWVTTGNVTVAAKRVRKFGNNHAASSAGYRWKESILKKIDMDFVMESVGLSDILIFKGLLEGIQAESVKLFQSDGKIITSKPMIDWMARAKHLDMASRIKGLQIDTVKHGLEKGFEEKIKKGVVILPALAFGKERGKDTDRNGQEGGGSGDSP